MLKNVLLKTMNMIQKNLSNQKISFEVDFVGKMQYFEPVEKLYLEYFSLLKLANPLYL